jgi:uncharacterized repeat protein (TIGR01451 family)
MKSILNRIEVKYLILFLFLMNSLFLMAQVNPYTQITTNPNHDVNPDIYERKIVYETFRNGSWDIYMYDVDLATEVPICTLASEQRNPAIWADKIVWQDYRNGNWDIYMYHLTNQTEVIICDSLGWQTNPDIWMEYIVYQDNRSGDFDIYMYDWGTFTEVPIVVRGGTPGFDAEQTNPAISDYMVVWQDFRNGNNDIYMYNFYLHEETQITTDYFNQTQPSISGPRIFYNDSRYGNSDVFLYYRWYFLPWSPTHLEWALTYLNIDRYLPVAANQKNTSISGDYRFNEGNMLVFQDDRNANEDIYMFAFDWKITGNIIQITDFPNDEENPAVWGDIVVWEDNRANISNRDIWMWERPPGADLAISILDSPDPVQLQSYVTYTINVTNHGPLDATNITMSDTLPNYTSLFSVTSAKGTCSQAAGIATCVIDTLTAGEQVTVTVVAKALIGGTITNHASVSQTEIDYLMDNNTAYQSTEVKSFIGYDLENGNNPSIATDQNGRAHISYSSDYPEDLVYQTNAAGDWTYELIDSSGFISESAITIDNNGIVHIAYIFYDWINAYVLHTNNTGGIWQPVDTVATGVSRFSGVDIASDSSNYIHVVYLSNMWTGSAYYTNNTTGSWSGIELYNMAYNSIALAIDKNNNAHAAFYSISINNGPCYMTNSPNGTWQVLEVVETNWFGGQMEGMVLDIAVDDLNIPHISYVGSHNNDYNENHKYATKVGGNWQVTLIESDDFVSAGNSICVNTDNSVHMVYGHMLSGEGHYATNDSGLWRLETLEDNGWMNDIAADINGNLHVSFDGINYMLKSREADGDGIPDEEEFGPNGNDPGYDGNGDGIPDSQQDEVASFNTYNDSLYVTLATEIPTVLSNVQAIDNPAPNDSGAPAPNSWPYGFFSFTVHGLDHGDSVIVKLILHGGTGMNTYYKYGPTPDSVAHWFEFDFDGHTGAVIIADTINLHLIDGLRGDYDVTVNGIIKEPGGPIQYITNIDNDESSFPLQYKLHQNYPNPFNPITHIKYDLPKSSKVKIDIFNILGQKVITLVDDHKKAGSYSVDFNGSKFASGLYFYRIEADNFQKTRKMIFMK